MIAVWVSYLGAWLIAWVFSLLGERDHYEAMYKQTDESRDRWFDSSQRWRAAFLEATEPKKRKAKRRSKR